MSPEEQVCSLELSKRLKELGVKKKSIFVWEYHDDKCYGVKFIPFSVALTPFNEYELFPAFTANELIDLLPGYIKSKKHENPFDGFRINIKKCFLHEKEETFNHAYLVNYLCDTYEFLKMENNPFIGNLFDHNVYDFKFSDALAKTLIKLIDEKYIVSV